MSLANWHEVEHTTSTRGARVCTAAFFLGLLTRRESCEVLSGWCSHCVACPPLSGTHHELIDYVFPLNPRRFSGILCTVLLLSKGNQSIGVDFGNTYIASRTGKAVEGLG